MEKQIDRWINRQIGRYDICSNSICSMAICSSSICSINHLLYSSQITTFALYVICSIRQLLYDITRHLLYKHFYDSDGSIALLNICSMSKHVICSLNIFYKYLSSSKLRISLQSMKVLATAEQFCLLYSRHLQY